MSAKKTTPPKKNTSKSSSTGKGKTTKGTSRGKSNGSTRSSTATKRNEPAQNPKNQSHKGLSADRKLDIVGVILALAGLLTILSLLSPINGTLTGSWVSLLGKTFGWGLFLVPIVLIVGGGWLILRRFEKIPRPGVERVIGFLLLIVSVLAIVHFIALLQQEVPTFDLAAKAKGGGYVGGLVVWGMESLLGAGGTAIALMALFLISLALALDISIYDMLSWIGKLFNHVKLWFQRQWTKIQSPNPPSMSEPSYPELTPLPRTTITPPENLNITPSFSPQTPSTTHPWVLPPIDQILEEGVKAVENKDEDSKRAQIIAETLDSFGAPVKVVDINRGPTITQFGVEPDFIETRNGRTRVRVGKIVALADDLALALSARTIRIQAPVPGKGYVGIEVPNETISPVLLRDVLESEVFRKLKTPLRFALGQNVAGLAVASDLSAMPHLLIAGSTGSGKSVCVNALICCLLMNNTPDDLRLIMVDPKRVELSGYNGIPHLLAPVVVDIEKVVSVLQWVTREMDLRYRKLSELGARNIQEFNNRVTPDKKIPYLVVVIDELADLMMLAPDETERTITRLAQMARATGIHVVIATQRPSVEVVTGLIKANFPARIAFAVASGVDSRVILDQPGAERLLGRGDMLFQAPDSPAPVRLQGVYVSDTEIFSLVTYWQSFAGTMTTTQTAAEGTVGSQSNSLPLKQLPMWDEAAPEENDDPLYKEAVDISRRQGRASISMLQRRLRIGYTRAARIIETMEERGIIGAPEPSTGTREILDYGDAAPPIED
jgi:DNA segregation ATPase FtsK/SpoIIIE, S-DNA-T family